MEFTIDSEDINKAFRLLTNVVPSSYENPILRYISVKATDKLQLVASNIKFSMSLEIPCDDIKTKGECLIPCKDVVEFSKEMLDDELHFKCDKDNCDVSGNNADYSLPSDDPKLFPEVEFVGIKKFTVKAELLKDAIKKTAFAVATEMTRYMIQGVRIVMKDDQLDIVATDTRRMSYLSYGILGEDFEVTVPSSGLSALSKAIEDMAPDEIDILVSDSLIVFCSEGMKVSMSLLSGRFPNYKAAMPDVCEFSFDIDKKKLMRMVRMSALTTDAQSRAIILTVSEGLLKASSATTTGKSSIEEVIEYDGEELKFKLNPKYVMDGLKNFNDDVVKVSFKTSSGPMLISDSSQFKYMVSPMSL